MKIDYHMHTKYSSDGQMSIEEACKKAIDLGIKEIAFTDHLEMEWSGTDKGSYYINLPEYIKDLERCRKRFKEILTIKIGIEVGLEEKSFLILDKILNDYPFDFIIGSVHNIQGLDPYHKEYYLGKTKEEGYKIYYEEILRLIKGFSNFDVLGHLDYIKRYSPHAYELGDNLLCISIIEEILKTLIEKKKGIEINTSGYRHISDCPMPSKPILARYKELGGSIITIGSDAHRIDSVGFGLDRGLSLLKEIGFQHVTLFTDREAQQVSIL